MGITRSEVIFRFAHPDQAPGPFRYGPQELFRLVDDDADGLLTAEEFVQAMKLPSVEQYLAYLEPLGLGFCWWPCEKLKITNCFQNIRTSCNVYRLFYRFKC